MNRITLPKPVEGNVGFDKLGARASQGPAYTVNPIDCMTTLNAYLFNNTDWGVGCPHISNVSIQSEDVGDTPRPPKR